MKTRKLLLVLGIAVTLGVAGYVALYVYNSIAQPWIEREIREAGLNPDDYDLSGVAPWNVRSFVTNKEIEKAGFDPKDYEIRGQMTAEEVRREVTRQEIARQLTEYDLTLDDIDLSGIDLLDLSPEEIQKIVYEKVKKKITPR